MNSQNKEFLVVVEKGKESYGAFAPDIPGCFAIGQTLNEVKSRYMEAVAAHLDWMANDHDPMPEPVTTSFDFSPEPGEERSSYYVEWVTVPVPVGAQHAISA
jgi:predicted RNase H-like HicB family nuclease